MRLDSTRVALLFAFKKQGDLTPPLGYPGGSCHVLERINEEVVGPREREKLILKLEDGKDLDYREVDQIYDMEKDQGPGGTPFRKIFINPHAQYRMDLRGVTVPQVRLALVNFHQAWAKGKSQNSPQYRTWQEAMDTSKEIRWVDGKSGLTIVFAAAMFRREEVVAQISTVFWTGSQSPGLLDRKECKPFTGWVEQRVVKDPHLSHLAAEKTSDLSPPLGYPGGPCHLYNRIEEEVKNPSLRTQLIEDLEEGEELSVSLTSRVYPVEEETAPAGTWFKKLSLTSHAQYRMDLRGITVPQIRWALKNFHKTWGDLKSQGSPLARKWEEDANYSNPIRWEDPKSGLVLVFEPQGDTAQIITSFWKNVGDPRPVEEASCNRVSSRHLESYGCRKTDVSWAWVDPKGKIYEIDEHGHAAWAEKWGEPLGLNEGQAYQKLFDEGWIRVTNFLMLEANELGKPAQAWATVAEMVADCLNRRNTEEQVSISVRKGWKWVDLEIGTFIERFGGRFLADKAFGKLVAARKAGGSRTLYYIGKRPARPVPGRRGPWKRPWLREPVPEAVFLTDNPAEVWRIDQESNASIREGNLYVYLVPEWVIKAAGGLHRWQGTSQGVSLVKEILITPKLWGEVTFKGSVPASRWREKIFKLPVPMAQKTEGAPIFGLPDTKDVGWRETKRLPRWRGLLTTSRPEEAVRAMSEQERADTEREIQRTLDYFKRQISSSRKETDRDERKLRALLSDEARKSLKAKISRDVDRRMAWGAHVTEAQKALDILTGTRPEVPLEMEKELAKITQWPNPWVRKHPDGETLEIENWSLLVHPWSPEQLKYKNIPGVYGLVKDEPLPKKQQDLLPYYEREKKRLSGKLEKETWIPLSPSTTGGRDYLQVSLYQGKDFMGRASSSKIAERYQVLALRKKKPSKTGDCYDSNGREFLSLNEKGLLLVHGEVTGQGPLEGIKYGHCWIEDGSTVIDVSNGRNLNLPKAVYYVLGRIGNNLHKYTREEFLGKILEHSHWGPWDLKTSTGL